MNPEEIQRHDKPTSPTAENHTPVLLSRVLEKIGPFSGHIVDATFGRGGYTAALLDAARQDKTSLTITAFDRDPDAIAFGKENFAEQIQSGQLNLVHDCFSRMHKSLVPGSIDAIVFDFGVSSPQLDQALRGFSFLQDGPLDMGMGCNTKTAADLVNHGSEDLLRQVLWTYGGEKRARFIAKAIVEKRTEGPLTTTSAIANLFPAGGRKSKIHPATRTFQALRIWTNDELTEIEQALATLPQLLKPGARLVSVSFHELEDRLMKRFLMPPKTAWNRHDMHNSAHLPLMHQMQKNLKPLGLSGGRQDSCKQTLRQENHNAKNTPSSQINLDLVIPAEIRPSATPDLFHCPRPQPVTPLAEEIRGNPRARSAKMRWGFFRKPAP